MPLWIPRGDMAPLDLACTAALIQARLREHLFFLLVLHVIEVVIATDMSFSTQEVLTCMEGVSDYIIVYSYYYSFSLSFPGIHTCSFGANQINNIGLYSEGSSSELYLFFSNLYN